jgi:hypothetical protein
MSSNAADNVHTEAEDKATISHIESPIEPTIDAKERKRLKLKLDLFVLPLISSVYFFASMVNENHQLYYIVFQGLMIHE